MSLVCYVYVQYVSYRNAKQNAIFSSFLCVCPLSFVIQALMSLFVLASKDGWVNIMYHGLDAVGVDQQVPIYKLHNYSFS